MHRQIHFRQANGGTGLFLAVESDLMAGIEALALDKVAALHEHTAGAAGRVKDHPMIRLNDIDDGLHQRGRGEEFAVVLRALHGELHQEIFIDSAKEIAAGGAYGLGIEGAENFFQQGIGELGIFLGQLTAERFELFLDGVHRLNQCSTKTYASGHFKQVIVPGVFRQH